jgi:transcriptional regulator with XRE-family HTH domain
MSVIAKRLKEARLKSGLSQERLGILAGLDEMTSSARMNQYERGKHVPDISIVERIGEVLQLPTAYFYADDDLTAEMLAVFHQMSDAQKKRVIKSLKE